MPDDSDSDTKDGPALDKLEARVARLEGLLDNLQGGHNINVEGGIITYTGGDSRSTTPST